MQLIQLTFKMDMLQIIWKLVVIYLNKGNPAVLIAKGCPGNFNLKVLRCFLECVLSAIRQVLIPDHQSCATSKFDHKKLLPNWHLDIIHQVGSFIAFLLSLSLKVALLHFSDYADRNTSMFNFKYALSCRLQHLLLKNIQKVIIQSWN